MLAALRFERRDAVAAHKLVDGLLVRAGREPGAVSDIRCGLHAAAAIQDGTRAAALLDRLSNAEPLLRAFARTTADRESGTMWLDIRVYPWSQIARQPTVADARQRLEAAYAKEREIARSALAGVP